MIVRSLQDAQKSGRRIKAENWESVRLLLRSDEMGFSFHITTIYAGTITPIWYRNHLESVYCIEGEGEIETVDDGKVYEIRPGVMYALNKHDKHVLRANSQLMLACVFNPALIGTETHDKDGVYPLDAEEVVE